MRVFATSRSLRQFYNLALKQNQFIDKAMTIGELFSRMVLVPDYSFVDDETRLLLLAQAADFEHFQTLQIERDILSFLHNSDYIFRFFEELSGENVEVESLDAHDTYAEYEEHLAVLTELRQRYKILLDEKKLIDRIFIPQFFTLNEAYLAGIGSIELELEGYLTHYELNLLDEASQIIPVTINFIAHEFNEKLQKRFEALGIRLEKGYHYQIDLSQKNIHSKEPYKKELHVQTTPFSERILQVAFIKKQISHLVLDEKIEPENIIIVLPDESFASTLAMFDDENNFNFAMGKSFKEEIFVKRFDAVMRYFDHPIEQHHHRYLRFIEGFEPAFELVRLHYSEACSMAMFEKIIEPFLVGIETESEQIIRQELFGFAKLESLLKGSSLKILLQLFMRRLHQQSLDDARGGKITVMGLLETRGATYDGVIVVDFNDEFVPK
ncbi:MAG: hypothetical protein OEW60_02495, partial [Thiovulaceae bacterium]|nr:hypothetical protein [Sulfurimonadaceae bacterium]